MTGEAISREAAVPPQKELDSEAALIRRAKERSREAWTEIYEQAYPKLFRYVQARVGDRETAEDLTASVFVEALKSIASYESRGRPLLAWLYRIARNVVNYHHRSRFRRQARLDALPIDRQPDDQPTVDEAGQPSAATSMVERWDLRQAIARLSADQREVILLRYFVGLTTPEVAALVGKHERAVYSLQTRAIQALRRHLR